MFRQLKNPVATPHCSIGSFGQVAPVLAADPADTLPGYGEPLQEARFASDKRCKGRLYVRQLRGSAPLINDPLLVQ